VSGVARRWAASRWRRCGCAGRGASLRPAAAAHGEEVRALAHERSDAEAGSWCDAVALRAMRCALAPMRRCVNACGENVCTCTHDEGGACRRVLGGLVARRWTSSGCGVDHAAPCADAAALPPRALWGTTPRAASLVLVLVLRHLGQPRSCWC